MVSKSNVFLICTGVGHINRGYESFTVECFNELKTSDKFELFLLKGGGASVQREISVKCVQRNSKIAAFLNKITGKEKYWLEQFTFLLGMLPSLIRYKPKVIYYSDFILGTFLWHLRNFFKLKYKLLFSNGAPNGPPFKTEDHIQQLLPMYVRMAGAAGTTLDKQTILPYAIKMDEGKIVNDKDNKAALLNQLSLPANKKIIICVGAVNSHHKRIDYLIDEFAILDNTDYFLLVLGQIDELSTPILEQAQKKLNADNYSIRQVSGDLVMTYLCVADYFILPSLREGLPRVLPEALFAGLLPIVHDYEVTRETLHDYGVFKDLTKTGILAEAIAEVDKRSIPGKELTGYAMANYSWKHLSDKYERLVLSMIDNNS